MLSVFFIYRPKFALVISLVITIAGMLGYLALPVEQFPNITPPVVNVSATYTGANAEVLEETVAAPIEAAAVDFRNCRRSISVPLLWRGSPGSHQIACKIACKTRRIEAHPSDFELCKTLFFRDILASARREHRPGFS